MDPATRANSIVTTNPEGYRETDLRKRFAAVRQGRNSWCVPGTALEILAAGLTSREIREKVPGWLLFNDGCPGGETPEQVGDRADRVIARARGGQGNVVLFTHGHLLRVLAARWLGFPASAGRYFFLDTGTLNILGVIKGAQP